MDSAVWDTPIGVKTAILNTYGQIVVAKKNLTLDTTVVFLITVREFCKPVDILAAILG